LAGFLLVHLAVQASALWGWELHRCTSAALDQIPLAVGLEIVCIYLPLVVHFALGAVGPRYSEEPVTAAPADSPKRVLLRLSALALLAFLAFHLWQFRWRLWTGQIDRADMFPELVASLSSTVFGGVPLTAVAYLIGIAAAVLHGVHCVYAVCRDFQLVSRGRQRALGRGCAAAGVALFLLGATVVIDLATGSALVRFPG
jgi:succinate dehydrogenase / fumarate reductase cytochrome b subunit